MSSTTASSTWPPGTTTASTPPLTGLLPTGATFQVGQGPHVGGNYLPGPQTGLLGFLVSGCRFGLLSLGADFLSFWEWAVGCSLGSKHLCTRSDMGVTQAL